MADSLFDVCLFLPSGEFAGYAAKSVPFSGALACSRGVNDHRKPTGPTAVVVPDDYYEEEIAKDVEAYHKGVDTALAKAELRSMNTEAPSTALDEPEADDDSDAEDDSEDAAESNLVVRFNQTTASAIDQGREGERDWTIIVWRGILDPVVVPNLFSKEEAERWVINWDGPELVWRLKRHDNEKLDRKRFNRKWNAKFAH